MKGNLFTTKKAGLLTKIVIFVLLAYTVYMMIHMQNQISEANAEVSGLSQQVEAQIQRNAELTDAIVNSDDIEQKKDIARERLGLLEPGEKIFNFTE